MEDLISVIVPVYNVELYLEKCVKSIINQTYKNLEILLVDDGSLDNSGKICDVLAKTDERIKVIHKSNGGLSSARNEAMKVAKGNLIGFVDSDDCITLDFYEYLHKLLTKYDADIAEAEYLRISADLINETEEILKEKNNEIAITEQVCNNLEAINILYGIKESPYIKKVVVWNKLYKKEILQDIVFPENRLHEDEFTTHKILYKAKKIVSSNKYIYGYMQTQNSIMRKEISFKRVEDNLGASLEALNFFKEENIKAKIMLRYLGNCIEFSGKISNEKSADKRQKLDVIEEKFIKFYSNMDYIKKFVTDELEEKVVCLMDKAYEEVAKNHNLDDFWNDLSEIIK